MSIESLSEHPVKKQGRSRVTNGKVLLEGIDGRSIEARRYRDLVVAYTQELGGDEAVGHARRGLVKQAAGVTVACETMQAAICRGEAIDTEQLVRLSNLQSRLLAKLGIGQPKSTAPRRTLADKLAQREAVA